MEITVKYFDELSTLELFEIYKARTNVFVVEQNCPYPEVDDIDKRAYHVAVREGGEIKAYCRVFEKDRETAHMGRVLSTERGKGWGAVILKAGIDTAKTVMKKSRLFIEAQQYAKGFYEKEGFVQISDMFLEDGIPHIRMMLDLE